MASSEAGLWDWLRGVLPLGQYSRIESPETAPGFPDVQYNLLSPLWGCRAGFIELKHTSDNTAEIPFKDERHGLRKTQKIWIRTAVRHQAQVWIIAEVTPLVYMIPGFKWYKFNGATKDELLEMSTACFNVRKPEIAAQELEKILLTTPPHLVI